jgi:hypothetical protein
MLNTNIQAITTINNYLCIFNLGKLFDYTLKKNQIFQNKVLRIITNAPWFIRNDNIHKDLKIVKIVNLIHTLSRNFHNTLLNSTGSLHYNLHIHPPLQRRLKYGLIS